MSESDQQDATDQEEMKEELEDDDDPAYTEIG